MSGKKAKAASDARHPASEALKQFEALCAARSAAVPVDWILEIRAAKGGDLKPLIASILAGKPIDGADNEQEVREMIARWLPGGGAKRRRGRPVRGFEAKTIVPWGVKASQFAQIDRRDVKLYAAARDVWQQQREGMPYADALAYAAKKHRQEHERLENWLRRPRRRGSNDSGS